MNEVKHARYFLKVKSIVFPSPALQISGESSWSACPVSPSCRPPQTGHSQRPRGGGIRPPHPPITSPHKGFNKWWARSKTNDGVGTAWMAATGGVSTHPFAVLRMGRAGWFWVCCWRRAYGVYATERCPFTTCIWSLTVKRCEDSRGWIWPTFCLNQLARTGIWCKDEMKSPSPYPTRSQPIGFREKQNAILRHFIMKERRTERHTSSRSNRCIPRCEGCNDCSLK